MSAGPFAVRSPFRTSHSGLRTTRRPIPASSRNRWAIAGGSGCSKGAATTGTPAPAMRAGRASGTSTSPRAGLGDEQSFEHLRHRVALPTDLQHEHVVRAGAGPADLDLRPGGPARRRAHGPEVEPPAATESTRLGLGHEADRLRDERLALDRPRAATRRPSDRRPRSSTASGARDSESLRSRGAAGSTHWGRKASRRTPGGGWAREAGTPPPTTSATASPAIASRRAVIDSSALHRAVIVWSALTGIKGKEKRPRGSPPWGVKLPIRSARSEYCVRKAMRPRRVTRSPGTYARRTG